MFSLVVIDMPNLIVIYLNVYDFYVVTVYRPPSYSELENNNLISFS